MSWCIKSETVSSSSDGEPSLCLAETLEFIYLIVYMLFFIIRYYSLSPLYFFAFLDRKILRFSRFISLFVILFILFSFFNLFTIEFHIIFLLNYFLSSILMIFFLYLFYLEVWRLYDWSSLTLKLYLLIYLIFKLIILIISIKKNFSNVFIFINILLFLLIILLCIFIILSNKILLIFYKYSLNNSSNINTSSNNDNNNINNNDNFVYINNNNTTNDDNLLVFKPIERNDSIESENFYSFVPFFGSKYIKTLYIKLKKFIKYLKYGSNYDHYYTGLNSSNYNYDEEELEELDFLVHRHTSNSLDYSRASSIFSSNSISFSHSSLSSPSSMSGLNSPLRGSTSYIPRTNSLVESAIDRNLNNSVTNKEKTNNSSTNRFSFMKIFSSPSTSISDSSSGSNSTTAPDSSLSTKLNFHDEEDQLPSSFNTLPLPTSRALMDVMNEHKAKISSANPLLEPRGEGGIGGMYHQNELAVKLESKNQIKLSNKLNDDIAVFGRGLESNNEKNREGNGQVKYLYDCLYNVSIENWGFRNSLNLSSGSGTNSPNSTSYMNSDLIFTSPSLPSSGLSSTLTTSEDDPSSSYIKEIEFEITVTAKKQNNNSSSSTSTKWSVWKTCREFFSFHSTLLSQLGDYTPLKPKFFSYNDENNELVTNINKDEINLDMRSMAVFFNSLLRNNHEVNIKIIQDFLNLSTVLTIFNINNNKESEDKIEDSSSSTTALSISTSSNLNNNLHSSSTTSGGSSPTSSQLDTNNSSSSSSSSSSSDQINDEEYKLKLKDKWRRMILNMRIKLKPNDIAVRCRQFEGVVNGSTIVAWLISSEDIGASSTAPSSTSSASTPFKHAKDRAEAKAIGQELVTCGLVIPVCVGFQNEEKNEDDFEGEEDDDNMSYYTSFTSALINNKDKEKDKEKEKEYEKDSLLIFNDSYGYIYRFDVKSDMAGKWTFFGSNIEIKIPTYVQDSDNNNIRETKGFRETFLFNDEENANNNLSSSVTNTGSYFNTNSSNTHVKYVIDIKHGTDSWQILRRFSTFEKLNKSLLKLNIKPEVSLPNKYKNLRSSLINAASLSSSSSNSAEENRRQGLENYLSSAIQAVIDNGSQKALEILAKFLDDSFNDLRILSKKRENDE